jgi:serine/threonine protein kinase
MIKDLKFPDRIIGEGALGKVYISEDGKSVYKINKYDTDVVIGRNPKTPNKTEMLIDNIKNNLAFISESTLTLYLDHVNIAKISDNYISEMNEYEARAYGIITVPMDIGLDKVLYSGTFKTLNLEQKHSLISQLFSAVYYMGQVGVVHRDIKPSNIMLTKDGILKIIDFGTIVPNNGYSIEIEGGTSFYMPPELLISDNKVPPAHSFDVWSAGVTALEIMLSYPVFATPGIISKDSDGVVYASDQYRSTLRKIMRHFPKDERVAYVSNDVNLDTFNEDSSNIEFSGDKVKSLFEKEPEDKVFVDFLINNVLIFNKESREESKYHQHEYLAKFFYNKLDVSAERDKITEKVEQIEEFIEKYRNQKTAKAMNFAFSFVDDEGNSTKLKEGKNSKKEPKLYKGKKNKKTYYDYDNDNVAFQIDDSFLEDINELLEK